MAYLFATPPFQALLCALHLVPPHAMILLRLLFTRATQQGWVGKCCCGFTGHDAKQNACKKADATGG
jgi:hypothetical protein